MGESALAHVLHVESEGFGSLSSTCLRVCVQGGGYSNGSRKGGTRLSSCNKDPPDINYPGGDGKWMVLER